MRLLKTERHSNSAARAVLSALALVVFSGGLAAAYAAAPTIKLAAASLADPTQAWQFYGGTTTHTAGVAAWSGRPPELVKLARSLGAGRYPTDQYAQRVFDYVRLNIETEFRFGMGKGARGAAVDQSGTPFDQAHLMVELLRQGGVTASYQVGPLVLTATEFGLWSGLFYNLNQTSQTFSVDAKAACTLLADGGIPASVNGASSCAGLSGPLNSVTLLHIWVSANGKLYDPSYKRHILKVGIDIPATMGCGSAIAPTCGSAINTAGLQNATQGNIGSAAFVQNINRSAIQGVLTTYAANLQTSIQNTDRFAQLEDIAGGAIIDVSYSPAVSSTLPYSSSQPAAFTTWTGDIPDPFRTTLAVQFLGIGSGSNPTQIFYVDELYGQRLRIATLGPPNTWTRTSNLYLEGRQLATAQFAAGQGTVDTVTLSINHPYAASASGSTTLDGTYADETIALFGGQDYRDANRSYPSGGGSINDGWPNTITIVCTLGRTGRGSQSLMSGLQATGNGEIAFLETAGYPVPEQHPALAAGMLLQQTQATRELEDVTKTKLSQHHTLGLVYTVYRDSAVSALFNVTSMVSAANATSSSTDRQAAFSTYALLAATIEGSVPQQGEDSMEADSAVSLLWHANDDQEPLIAITNSSDMAAVSGTLQSNGYSQARINNISQIVQSGYQIILPRNATPPLLPLSVPPTGGQSASLTLGASGEIVTAANEVGYDVFERQKGAGAIAGLDPTMSVLQAVKLASYSLRDRSTFSLDTAEGLVRLTPPADIVVGTGPYPASLQFQRTYSSSDAAQENCSWDSDANLNCEPIAEGGYRSVLGNGWRHNFQISAEWANNGLEAFAATSAVRASSTLTDLYAAFDLARSTALSQSLAQVMVAYSMGASLMKNSFVIHLPEKTLTFARLPDGTYDSPINEPAAQITTNSLRNGPYCCAYYDYSPTTLQYRGSDGDVMNFSPTGSGPTFDIGNWTTPDGVQVQFTYSDVGPAGHGLLASVSNNLGHRLSFTIGMNNYIQAITAVTDENNRAVYYGTSTCVDDTYVQQYFSHANFSQSGLIFEDCRGTFTVKGVDGQTTSYSYMPDANSPDPTGGLLPRLRLRKWFTPLSPASPYLTVTYDQQMQVQTLVDAMGNTTSAFTAAVADESDKLGEVQDAAGAVSRSYFDRYDNPLIQIDALGRVASNFYDDARRRVQTIDPEGDGLSYQYDVRSNLLQTTQFSKPGSGVPSIVGPINTYSEGPAARSCTNLPTCNKSVSVQDASGNLTRYTYSSSTGQLLTATGPALTNGISGNPLTTYCYSSYNTTNADGTASMPLWLLTGAIKQVTGSTTRVSTYAYNTANHYVLSSATSDPVTSLTPPAGSSLSCPGVTQPGGLNLVMGVTFDAIGNLVAITDPRGNGAAYSTSYSFDSMRRLTRVVAPPVPALGASQTPITRYTYDVDGELSTIRHSIVASPSDPDPTNPSPPLTAGDWQTETRSYWPTGDLQSVQDANNNLTQYAYDPTGRLNLVTDPDGRQTGTVYDSAGEVACIWKGWNSATAPSGCSWNPGSYTDGTQPLRYAAYTYTPNGKQQTITDADSNITQLAYDGVDRLYFTLFPDPDNGTLCALPGVIASGITPTCSGRQTYEQYGYDNNGNRTSVRTRKADVITSTYNSINLLDTKTVPALPTVNYTYYLTGDEMSVTQGGHSTGYQYDGAGRKHDESNDGRTVIYGYDPAGNRASVQWPDGYLVSYVYDALDRMQDVYEGAPGASLLAHYDYDILSRRHALTYGGNSANTQGYGYEPNNSLSSLTHQMAATALSFGFVRNNSRQITSLTVSDGFYLPQPTTAASAGYAVNALNEYTAVGPITGTDANGKPVIAGARGKIIAIPFDDLQIVFPAVAKGRSPVDTSGDPGGNTVVHDLNGNLRRWTGPDGARNTYTYDAENRARTAITSTHNVSYDYDALGRRISKTVDGVQTGYLLDGDEEIAEYSISSGTWPATPARRYILGPAVDDRIAMVDATNGNAKSYYHVNHEGSVVVVADSGGNVTQQISYDEYGNLSGGSSTTGQAFRYAGRRFDAETGLYYYRARYYAPQIGRFLQTDPVGYMDDLNVYAYVGNDPVNATDPSGLKNCAPDDHNCIETPDSAQTPGDPTQKPDDTRKLEEVLVTAHKIGKDTDGKPIQFNDGEEHAQYVTPEGIHRAKLTPKTEVQCPGSPSVVVNIAHIPQGTTPSHTHPTAYGTPGSVPGPGDDRGARGSPSHAAFLMTAANVFTIEAMPNGTFRTTVAGGPPLTDAQRSYLVANMQNWENAAAHAANASMKQQMCGKSK